MGTMIRINELFLFALLSAKYSAHFKEVCTRSLSSITVASDFDLTVSTHCFLLLLLSTLW